MMTSITGKLLFLKPMRRQSGFTLIEVMLCVVILSVGLVAVNQAMLGSLDVIRYTLTRAEADRVADLKIWDIRSHVRHQQKPPALTEQGTLLGTSKTFQYQMKSAAEGEGNLYRVRLQLNWSESSKNRGLIRDFYVRLPPSTKK